MKLRVEYTAQLRAAVGHTEEVVELPDGSSLLQLLFHVAACRSNAKPHLVNDRQQACPSLLIVVNDAAVAARDAARTRLSDGDVVTFLPPIAGG